MTNDELDQPSTGWETGELIVRREVGYGRPWLAVPVFVVQDSADLLATYLPEGAPFGYLPDSDHPLYPQREWRGHGTLMLQRPGEAHAAWHFWAGPDRHFSRWYINLQEPFRRTPMGFDTQDQELDIVVAPDRSWIVKDSELLDQRLREGRFTPSEAREIRAEGQRIIREVGSGRFWWDDRWTKWEPDPGWIAPNRLPEGWEDLSTDRTQ
jgi:Protein of unknown function (DUF402)